jgi:hypothetical protein
MDYASLPLPALEVVALWKSPKQDAIGRALKLADAANGLDDDPRIGPGWSGRIVLAQLITQDLIVEPDLLRLLRERGVTVVPVSGRHQGADEDDEQLKRDILLLLGTQPLRRDFRPPEMDIDAARAVEKALEAAADWDAARTKDFLLGFYGITESAPPAGR